jgi:secondary thiamine-phosphate synthase enzyme
MEQILSKLEFITNGEGFIDITNDLNLFIKKNNFDSGILNLTSLHTSCSLTINENADPNVLRDLKKYMQSIVPYNSYLTLSKNREEISYKHYQEGADDMPAHIKTSLTNTSLSLSFQHSNIMLGTWQAVYLWEHRFDQKRRVLNVHIIGEKTQNIYNEINKN